MKHEHASGTPRAAWHEERRSTVRVPVDLVAAYTIGPSAPVIATVSELANTSFQLVTSQIIPVGTRLTIAFPAGALLSKEGLERVHVFFGEVVHTAAQGAQYRYGIDLIPTFENGDDLRWTILQLSLRRTARKSTPTIKVPKA